MCLFNGLAFKSRGNFMALQAVLISVCEMDVISNLLSISLEEF